jgi:hypothetical protein
MWEGYEEIHTLLGSLVELAAPHSRVPKEQEYLHILYNGNK